MIAVSHTLDRCSCACCSSFLAPDDDYCNQCQMPASLSHSIAGQDGEHSFISVLGASNAGKTVYLGLLLDILSKGPADFKGVAASSFAVDLQEYVVNALERRSFPEKTPAESDAWQWLHYKLLMKEKKSKRTAELISPDFAGEAIAAEISRPGLYPAVAHVVSRSKGLLILCDSVRVRDQGASEDLFAMKLASYIAERHKPSGERFDRGDHSISLAVVFTKCDTCPEAARNPTAFAANNTPRLYDFCRQTFPRIEFFAAGVAGSTGVIADTQGLRMSVPFHIQPCGVLEPLRWIFAGQ